MQIFYAYHIILIIFLGWGIRHLVVFLGFWGFAMSYAMRFNLSIAIVAMVKRNSSNIPIPVLPPLNNSLHHDDLLLSSSHYTYNNKSFSAEKACPIPVHTSGLFGLNSNPAAGGSSDEGEFEWDEVQQGIILGSFFWGYMCTQLPGGIIAQKYVCKYLIGHNNIG